MVRDARAVGPCHAHRLSYHSTLGVRAIKKKKLGVRGLGENVTREPSVHATLDPPSPLTFRPTCGNSMSFDRGFSCVQVMSEPQAHKRERESESESVGGGRAREGERERERADPRNGGSARSAWRFERAHEGVVLGRPDRCQMSAVLVVRGVLNLRTTTPQKCEAVPRRARI